MENLEHYCGILEACLFALGEPVELSVLARAIGAGEIVALQALNLLREGYEHEDRGIRLLELDGRYQLCTKKEYYDNLITIVSAPEKPNLTEALMETLAIVAYRQPVTKSEIARVRGVSSDHAVSRLVEFGLIREAGRLNAPGRPMLFVTTEEFLRRFGMESTEYLPEQEKLEELDAKIASKLEEEDTRPQAPDKEIEKTSHTAEQKDRPSNPSTEEKEGSD